MRIEYLNKTGSRMVILFFNGWGMDKRATAHLKIGCDLVMFSDYRTLDIDDLPALDGYETVYVVAWSMGVWAAAQTLPQMNVSPKLQIAINGTEYPIDNVFGIPEGLYRMTENSLADRGLEKFFRRILASKENMVRFKKNRPRRNLEEQIDELRAIRKASDGVTAISAWNIVYISENDVIFSVENQLNWWDGKTEIRYLSGGHYPFYDFESWEEIIKL